MTSLSGEPNTMIFSCFSVWNQSQHQTLGDVLEECDSWLYGCCESVVVGSWDADDEEDDEFNVGEGDDDGEEGEEVGVVS